jgi:hypothetical protein
MRSFVLMVRPAVSKSYDVCGRTCRALVRLDLPLYLVHVDVKYIDLIQEIDLHVM